ncbi:MAG: hypothetical protein NZ957_00430 [Thaumarchaeota archaeon]|nr:hypothetical protein [Candidatus Calditenuaceae archaeon]MDW8041244.1 hypothetical protein [Nitrososphaerota archaeon]
MRCRSFCISMDGVSRRVRYRLGYAWCAVCDVALPLRCCRSVDDSLRCPCCNSCVRLSPRTKRWMTVGA